MNKPLKPIDLTTRGKFLGIDLLVSCTEGGMLELYNGHFKKQFEELMTTSYPGSYSINFRDSEAPIIKPKCKAQVLAITAILNFEKPTCLQVNVLIDKPDNIKSPETLPVSFVKQIIEVLKNESMVTDEYHTDQLLVFMALAEGQSKIACGELSLHSQTIVELLRIFKPEINISVEQVGESNNLITVNGIAYHQISE